MTRLQKLNEARAIVKGSRNSMSVRIDRLKLSVAVRNRFRMRYLDAVEALYALEHALDLEIQVEINNRVAK